MSSAQAADWLTGAYPLDSDDWGEAMVLLPHRSWGKTEQHQLADHFLRSYRSQVIEGMKVLPLLCL